MSWIASAEEAVQLAKNADEARRQVALLEEARTDLERLIAEFRVLVEGVSVVRPFGWEGKYPSPDLARDLAEAAASLDSRPLNRVIKALERFRGDVHIAVKERWSAYASHRLGDVTDLLSLSETLSEVEGIAGISQELRTALGELARTQSSAPSQQSAELLTRAEVSLRRLEESLKPDSVRRFLSAVARGGASIELMTADVIDWLKSHNALDRFRIVAGSPVDDADV
ncbi:hypothetical protein [Nocardioides pelophilus]|uniref:hypothetical protein n=1 Tax=Nocardioides pelophilus TaxID=2172019 RepID=UPI001603AC12|nr:hypothetical protein [Nocardioides pelophilus]